MCNHDIPFEIIWLLKKSSIERRILDARLDQAMEEAASAATIVVNLGKDMDMLDSSSLCWSLAVTSSIQFRLVSISHL